MRRQVAFGNHPKGGRGWFLLALLLWTACGEVIVLERPSSDAGADAPVDAAGCDADLTSNPDHCGSCGHSCLGGACEAGACQPFAIAPEEVYSGALAVDGVHVYWGVGEGVRTATVSGGGAALLAKTPIAPYGIAAFGDRVYWAINGGAIMSVPKAGGMPVELAPGGGGDIAVDGAHVYWVDIQLNRVLKVGVSGGPVTTLASSQGEPRGIALDATDVYWPNAGSGTVVRVPKSGGGVSTVAAGQKSPAAIAVDGSSVYWIADHSAVLRAPLAGGAPEVLAGGQSYAHGVAVDETHIYWTNGGEGIGTGTVMKMPKAGGAPVTLASGQAAPEAIALDTTAVYWTNYASKGPVMKVAK